MYVHQPSSHGRRQLLGLFAIHFWCTATAATRTGVGRRSLVRVLDLVLFTPFLSVSLMHLTRDALSGPSRGLSPVAPVYSRL